MIVLYNHQKEALRKTEGKNRVAYYLDMGLGKTFVGSEKLNELNENINLVVCQKSKIEDWAEHFKEHYKDYDVIIYNKQELKFNKKTILIINYDLCWRREELKTLRNFTLMLDESSLIKHLSSQRTKFILKLRCKNVILLSGTPVGGKYEDLYSQLRLLGWNITKKEYFEKFIVTTPMNVGTITIQKVIGYKNVDELKRKLMDLGAVFMKTESVFNLPDALHKVIKVKNNREYLKMKKDRVVEIDNKELVAETSLTLLLCLRQICSIHNKNKYQALQTLLESTEDRLIIFYNFKEELENIKLLCKKNDRPISFVNGYGKDLTNYEVYDNSVTLIQYQAGAMGLNLQKANKIIYNSLPLQSELFEQSKKRTHRLGQNRSCFYYYLITKNSVEEQILKTLEERKNYTDELFREMNFRGMCQ